MIYLLGISHNYQTRFFKTFREGVPDYSHIPTECQFDEYLDQLVSDKKPKAICQEESASDLAALQKIDERAYSIAERVSGSHSIEHVFCDPDQAERNALYAASSTTEEEDRSRGYPIRESEWLRRIDHLLPDTLILFICGANHVDTFAQKLDVRKIAVKVICKDLKFG